MQACNVSFTNAGTELLKQDLCHCGKNSMDLQRSIIFL